MEAIMITRLIASATRAIEIGRRRRMLRTLPDDILKDIGISRCEIDYVAAAPADERRGPMRAVA